MQEYLCINSDLDNSLFGYTETPIRSYGLRFKYFPFKAVQYHYIIFIETSSNKY